MNNSLTLFPLQGNTSIIEAIYFYIVDVAEWSRAHIAKRLVLQCINGVSSNPVEEKQKFVSSKI